MASLPSDENPELAPGQQPINRGNINREIIDGELVDYGDSADEEEPAAQVAAAEGRQRQNAGDILAPASGKKLNALHRLEIQGKMRMLVTLLFRLQGRKLNALHGLETSCKKCRQRLLVILNA